VTEAGPRVTKDVALWYRSTLKRVRIAPSALPKQSDESNPSRRAGGITSPEREHVFAVPGDASRLCCAIRREERMSLYKYVTADRIDILKNELIRITQPAALNDPLEMRTLLQALLTNEGFDKYVCPPTRSDAAKRLIDAASGSERKRIQQLKRTSPAAYNSLIDGFINQVVIPFRDHLRTETESFFSELHQYFGLLCLSENATNPMMWAHYANNNGGLVIEFDDEHRFFAPGRTLDDSLKGLHKILYRSDRRAFKDLEDLCNSADGLVSLFFTKGNQWEHEQEWRMVRPLNEAGKSIQNPSGDIHLFRCPSSCIKGLIFGMSMPESTKSEIASLLKSESRLAHITLSRAVTSDASYDFLIEPL
jgi:hypothetical protein